MTLTDEDCRRLHRLRARARLRGVGVHLSRKAFSPDNLGGLMLIDIASNTVLDGARLDLSLAAAEDRVDGIVEDFEAAAAVPREAPRVRT